MNDIKELIEFYGILITSITFLSVIVNTLLIRMIYVLYKEMENHKPLLVGQIKWLKQISENILLKEENDL